jgi:hypothetical protein
MFEARLIVMFHVPGAGADMTLAVQHQQVPAFRILRGSMESFRRQLVALNRPILQINAPPQTLHFFHEPLVVLHVVRDLLEGIRQRGVWWRDEYQALLDRRNVPLE